MIEFGDASEADLCAVFDALSDVSLAEKAHEPAGPPFAIAHIYCGRDELGPLFVFGIGLASPGVWRTSFAATQRYFDMGAAGVLALRRFVRRIMAEHEGDVFTCRTTSPHPDVARWYRLLGAKDAWTAEWRIGVEDVRDNGRVSTFRFEP